MKRLSISVLAVVLALVLLFSGISPRKAVAAAPALSAHNAHFQVYYYFYTYPGDSFVDYESVSFEELEYLIYYGWVVDTDPRGGTLISRGYLVNTYPHSVPPSVFLYRH